uniref:DEAD/DEAH box helicase family protein n=1 Tax=Micrococcus sp. KRD077 TaxID=2729720 RepID=UPI0031454295
MYLRTIFELAAQYNFTKFVILVPSVAIREGVNTSIRLMRSHFEDLYKKRNITFDSSVYSGKTAEEVQSFATSTNVQIMVMTIDSIRGNANTRIIHQTRDKLNGLKPIDYLKATHPVVIMDEPQNMESLLSQSAVSELDPVFTLRYSATHKKLRNVVYRLDPVDAHDLGLVKQIVVADVQQQGADATPYIKLIDVRNDKGWVARLELSCRKADGSLERRVVNVKQNQELSDPRLTNNANYDGWRVNEMSIEPAYVDLTLHGYLVESRIVV